MKKAPIIEGKINPEEWRDAIGTEYFPKITEDVGSYEFSKKKQGSFT
jgi:hypothetical protein